MNRTSSVCGRASTCDSSVPSTHRTHVRLLRSGLQSWFQATCAHFSMTQPALWARRLLRLVQRAGSLCIPGMGWLAGRAGSQVPELLPLSWDALCLYIFSLPSPQSTVCAGADNTAFPLFGRADVCVRLVTTTVSRESVLCGTRLALRLAKQGGYSWQSGSEAC